ENSRLQLFSTRDNSYFARAATRQSNSASVTSEVAGFTPDFLDILTAIAELYTQDNVLPMQQVDGAKKHDIGSGAVFQVSSVKTNHISPSHLMADEVSIREVPVILKRSPLELFEDNGIPLDNDQI